ncbi:MAG: glycosyltransferase family 2 protein [Paludibacteraceae bacterium]|nr:glycosyltransferase family 2 protein [Paludibacteraceae bacterium]
MEKKCSIVILNWNGADMLRRYLPVVIEHTRLSNTEIVVADNGSTDNSLAVVQSFPEVRVIVLDRNYGFAEGYNRALQDIRAEYTVLLNSDVEVTGNWLQPLLDYMDAHPDVAATMPKIRSAVHRDRFEHAGAAGGLMDMLIYPYCRGRILSHIDKDEGQFDTVIPVFWTTGACMCVRTGVYHQTGGLDSDFFAHMEEIDLCWRMQCRGYRLACIPQSTVYHVGGGSLHYESPRKTYLNFRNCLLMIYKNLPKHRLLYVYAMRCLLDYLAAVHLLLSGQPRNAWAVCRARWDFWRMKSSYKQKRKDNLQKAIVPYPETIAKRSIIVDYYFRGMRQ